MSEVENQQHAWAGVLKVVESITRKQPGAFEYQSVPGMWGTSDGSSRSRAQFNDDGSVSTDFRVGQPDGTDVRYTITVQVRETEK